MVDVVIVTPGFTLHNSYVSSLVSTLIEFNERKITYNWVNGASSLVHHAREVAASAGPLNPDDIGPFGGRDYGTMLWIDSDISWKTEDVIRLLESPYEVTTGAYLLADGFTSSVHALGKPGGIPMDEILSAREPIKVQSMGFGFTAIKRGVFERIPRPWFSHLPFQLQKSDGTFIIDSLGEDISWCIKAYQSGIEIWFDPRVLVNHHKTLSIGWPDK